MRVTAKTIILDKREFDGLRALVEIVLGDYATLQHLAARLPEVAADSNASFAAGVALRHMEAQFEWATRAAIGIRELLNEIRAHGANTKNQYDFPLVDGVPRNVVGDELKQLIAISGHEYGLFEERPPLIAALESEWDGRIMRLRLTDEQWLAFADWRSSFKSALIKLHNDARKLAGSRLLERMEQPFLAYHANEHKKRGEKR